MLVPAIFTLLLIIGVPMVVGAAVAFASRIPLPIFTSWAAHPWAWFVAGQLLAVPALVIPSTRPALATLGAAISIPSAVQGLRVALDKSRRRFWFTLLMGLVIVLVARAIQRAVQGDVPSSPVTSPLVLLPWSVAAIVAHFVAIQGAPATSSSAPSEENGGA